MPMFPDAWKSELLSKTDIVQLISEYVTLNPKGQRFWGCCPFHDEKTPSFAVMRDKQFYYCFGCHATGDAITFLMEAEKLNYVEAVKQLAQRANMELPDEVNDETLQRERALRERLYAACTDAARYFHSTLMGERGKPARVYLKRRGMDLATVRRFGLGYAPEGWDNLLKHMKEKGYSEQELIQAGLAVQGKTENSCYDAYRDRVIFPIIATNGKVVGFGARTMGDDTPKYINTGDTPIYNKRYNVYGLNLMKGKKFTELIMVEGYMDVISLHKAGVDNAVASLGTALTSQQARLMKRYVDKVLICYDGDAAGQSAMIRGMDILSGEGLSVRVMVIPGGQDPDDYVKKFGKDAYLALKKDAMPLNAFKLRSIEADFDLDSADGREGYAKHACEFVGGLQPVEQERYAPVIAGRSGLALSTVKAQLGLHRPQSGNSFAKNRNNMYEKTPHALGFREKTEYQLMACMFADKEIAESTVKRMDEEGIELSPAMQGLIKRLLEYYAARQEFDAHDFLSGADDDGGLVMASEMQRESIQDASKMAVECLRALKRLQLEDSLTELSREAAETGDADKRTELMQRLADVNKKLREIK